jgi:hypothetical protein
MAGGSKGIGAGLKIDSAVAVLTDVSSWLRGVNGGNDPARLDDTTFQPDVAAPIKSELRGFASLSLSLTVLYSAAAFTFFAAIEGLTGLNYQFGPNGFTAGDQKISGLCNVLSVSLPSPTTDNVQEFTVTIVRTSQVVGTF